MACTTDLWIILIDRHERRGVDGSWGEAIARLWADRAIEPFILTEPRIAGCLESLVPADRLRIARHAEAVPWIDLGIDEAEILTMLDLRGRSPDPQQWNQIRSFGLRAAIMGSVLARETGRPHIPFFAGSLVDSAVPPFDQPRARAISRLIESIVLTSAAVETPDEDSAVRLSERTLTPAGSIRAATPVGSAPASATDPPPCGILASVSHRKADRIAIEAIGVSSFADRQLVDWLALRQGNSAMRFRQTVRRLGLADRFRWEEEPWRRASRWLQRPGATLLIPSPRRGVWPLTTHWIRGGGRVLVPEDAEHGPIANTTAIPWTIASLSSWLGEARAEGCPSGQGNP